MHTFSEHIRRSVFALQAVDLIIETYASGTKGGDLTKQIADTLALHQDKMGKYGGLSKQVAAAIYRGVLNQEPPDQAES